MRLGVWCGAAALALLTLASALRTPQVESASRVGRRLPAPSAPEAGPDNIEEEAPTFRPRISRRREEILNKPRERTRSRPTAPAEETSPRNERFDSRRTTSRTRTKPVDNASNNDAPTGRDHVYRSRTRPPSRRTPTQSEESPVRVEHTGTVTHEFISRAASRSTTPKPDEVATQYNRQGTTSATPNTFVRRRGRINTRVDAKALDLAVSGTTNTITVSNKEPTTARTVPDQRNQRKLRYRTRTSETETNLTGEGLQPKDEVTKSSQNKENITSHPEIQTTTPTIDTTVSPSTEAPPRKPSLPQTPKVVLRRPLTRGKPGFKPTAPASKKVDEISEDDNYPESFKALLHAKNASTQTSSPKSESLSVKASEKIFKTYTSSPQSTNTGPAKNKYTRFRSKITTPEEPKMEESKMNIVGEEKPYETTTSSEQIKPITPEFKLRPTFSARNRKINSSSSPTASSATEEQIPGKSSYKYSRKFKPSTTEIPKLESTSKFKRLGTNTLLKKSLARPSYSSRRNVSKNLDTSSEASVITEKVKDKVSIRKSLPRTSYYSRLRTKINETISTTPTPEPITDIPIRTPAENKMEDSADMPLIFSLLKKPSETETIKTAGPEQLQVSTKEPEKGKQMFIIAVTSKESSENSTENEVPTKSEEVVNKVIITPVNTNPMFYANVKDSVTDVSEINGQELIEPPKTRKSGRRRTRPDHFENKQEPEVTSKPRERNSKKFSESIVKSTEPSTNGIPPEPEKVKSRFSSKYRASYLDKPIYKATVPTVTPSTVEGEEIQLGPDMNAISFTKIRSTLSSADLRLSESLDKPSHTMNVEASQHSPSVTVSIFDALADILTSTPRIPRLSSTTEVTKNTNINDIQILDGVSNSITVNNVKGLADQDTSSTIDDTNLMTKSVLITQTTPPTVINRMSGVETTTPSLNTQDVNASPVNTPTYPTPLSTTPLSARKPFAIKVLYTEQSTDKTTATESTRTSIQPSTDIPSTVHNTVSDFLLTNNNFVSSELTSMLSNNIKNIIQNMDAETRSKISVDMAKLLKTLIPRALNITTTTSNDDADIVPNTTPYSLEELKDTENVGLDIKNSLTDANESIDLSESLQTVVTDRSVNSNVTSNPTTPSITENPTLAVNSNDTTVVGTSAVSSSQVTSADASLITLPFPVASSTVSPDNTQSSTASSPVSSDTVVISKPGEDNRLGNSLAESTNINVPLPFFTNFKVRDFTVTPSAESVTPSTSSTLPIFLTKSASLPIKTVQETTQVSPLQLWVLSKKARVLQMIEDLIRQHNDEISTAPPVTDMLSESLNIPLSNRLTQILNTMSSTTEPADAMTQGNTQSMTTPSLRPFPLSPAVTPTESNIQPMTTPISDFPLSSTSFTQSVGDTETGGTTEAPADIFSRLSFTGTDETGETGASTEMTELSATTVNTNKLDGSSSTTPENIETTTDSMNTETMQTTTDFSTMIDSDITTTDIDTETTTNLPNERPSLVSNRNNIQFSNEPPKKDYVIFGILPNDTVVRKDPNEDILETLTEASPYIIYSLLPNNTVIRRFPNGTRVPRVMQQIDVLPISPWSLRNPYSPIHNNPAIVKPRNPIRVSTNIVTSTDTSNNGSVTNDTVNNQQPMTKQIRTERPGDGSEGTVFKYIPIDRVTAAPEGTNVLKLASTKAPPTVSMRNTGQTTANEMVTQTPQVQTRLQTDEPTTAVQMTPGTPPETMSAIFTNFPATTESITTVVTMPMTTIVLTTTEGTTTTDVVTNLPTTSTTTTPTTNIPTTTTTEQSTTPLVTTVDVPSITDSENKKIEEDANFLRNLFSTERNSRKLDSYSDVQILSNGYTTTDIPTTRYPASTTQFSEEAKLLEAILAANNRNQPSSVAGNIKVTTKAQTTTQRSIEDDIRQFEEDTKLLKALLAATGQNPASLNIPSLDSLNIPTKATSPPKTTARLTTTPTITTQATTTTTNRVQTTTQSVNDDLKKLTEDAKLLEALLQATGQNKANPPVISGVTSNVRIASNPKTTSVWSNPTPAAEVRPVYTSRTTSTPVSMTVPTVLTTLQPGGMEGGISTTLPSRQARRRFPTTTVATARRVPASRFTVTTEIPSTSTFSDEEDLQFLQNLKSVLSNSPDNEDPESALANRIIALAVERSLNDIETGKQASDGQTGRPDSTTPVTRPPTTTTTTTATTTTTTPRTTTARDNTPSLDEDIKKFEEDTKLLQALLKATGQDPSKFNIPTLPPNINTNTKVSSQLPSRANDDLKLLSNLLASPSPLNEPFENLNEYTKPTTPTTPRPFGAKIAVKDELKNEKDDAKLLQTLVKLQGVTETTTQRSKIAITGQSSDEALKKLIQQQTRPSGMVSEATKAPVSISTEYGKSNDALLAALLKEQGFGPTTASSLDEQLRLAVPLEPPRAVASEQGGPGRGQIVSAAINVTRAFSQFLGAAIAGAAQTVQNVIRAGQRATADAYGTGSG